MTRRARRLCAILAVAGITLTHFAVVAMVWGA